MISPSPWLEFLRAAAVARFGVVLAVSDVTSAKQKLYQARAKAMDPSLAGLQIRQSPDERNHLWLVNALSKE